MAMIQARLNLFTPKLLCVDVISEHQNSTFQEETRGNEGSN